MDYHSADSYFLNAPGFTTQLILLEPNESFGNHFPTTFQSNIPRIDWGTSDIKICMMQSINTITIALSR